MTETDPSRFEQSSREIDRLLRHAMDLTRQPGNPDGAVDAWQAAVDHPCAWHHLDQADLYDELHQALRRAGRWDDAIAARRASIDAGYQSRPDPEADIAEILIDAGRHEEAAVLYDQLRQRDPDDVWLYNSAAYSSIGVDNDRALRWVLDGIEVAIATGDHDQILPQLLDFTHTIWNNLNRQPDQRLLDRITAFQADWSRPAPRPWPSTETPRADPHTPCAHCGYHPDHPPELALAAPPAVPTTTPTARRETAHVAVAWFPLDAYVEATQRWPSFDGYDADGDHQTYNRRIEANTKALAAIHGHNPSIAPLTISELIDYATEHDHDPGTGAARAALAAEMARTGRAIAWPPGRNEPCWCRSGRKYKKCCGPAISRPG